MVRDAELDTWRNEAQRWREVHGLNPHDGAGAEVRIQELRARFDSVKKTNDGLLSDLQRANAELAEEVRKLREAGNTLRELFNAQAATCNALLPYFDRHKTSLGIHSGG